MSTKTWATTWVECPICKEPDMKCESDSEGYKLISCVNHACKSNGGKYQKLHQPLSNTRRFETQIIEDYNKKIQNIPTQSLVDNRDNLIKTLTQLQHKLLINPSEVQNSKDIIRNGINAYILIVDELLQITQLELNYRADFKTDDKDLSYDEYYVKLRKLFLENTNSMSLLNN